MPSQPKSLPTIPKLLFRLVLACLVPALLGASLMIYREYEHSHAQRLESARLSVSDKLIAVDAQLAQAELFAQTLAFGASQSPVNFAEFHRKSVAMLRAFKLNYSVILYDATGQQLLNTHLPYGTPLGQRPDKGPIESVFATGHTVSSTVITRISNGRPKVRTLAPIFSGSKVMYALAVGFPPENLNSLLEREASNTDTVIGIMDSTGTLAARSHEATALVGQKAHASVLKLMQTQPNGTVAVTTTSGTRLLVTFERSSRTGWSVAIGMPLHSIAAPLNKILLLQCLGSALLLGLSLLSAWAVGRRITTSLRSLQAAALALGRHQLKDLPDANLLETKELSQALKASALRLERRTQQLLAANESLQERSAELSEAQHIAQIGNWKWDANTDAIQASDELLRLYGRKILLPFAAQQGAVFPEAAWQELKAAVKAALQSRTGFALLLLTAADDGRPLWARLLGEPVCNAFGEVTGLRGTLQDVDAATKSVLALQDSAKRYRALFDESLEAIVIHQHGAVAFTNSSAVTLFAAAAESDLVGKSLNQFIHPYYRETVAARFSSITRAATSVPPLELKFLTLQGKTFIGQARSTEFISAGERFVQTHIRDLTEQKRKDAEIAHLQTEMHDVLIWQVAQHTVAALAHEVNQPLASAAILCTAVKRTLASDEIANADKFQRLDQMVQRIGSDIERAGEVLRNLLDSVNKPDITRTSVRVEDLVAESILAALEDVDLGYEINTDHGADLPAVKVNSLQVIKVLLNLIHNAVQAMHGAQNYAGKVWIQTALSTDGSEICVSVRDEGPGISTALQQEVFQPFISTKTHGLGMGLTISRALIEAHGGKLWHSQEGTLGATFHFTLPITST